MRKKVLCLFMLMCVGSLVGCGNQKETSEQTSVTDIEVSATETPEATIEEITTEEEKEQYEKLSQISISWIEDKKYVVGDNLTVDENGRIVGIVEGQNTIKVEYDEEGLLTRFDVTYKDGTSGFETISYDDSMTPVSNEYKPNNYRSDRDTVIEATKDSEGRIEKLTESNSFVNSDGESSSSVTENVYKYDSDGNITEKEYYSKGKLDHVTTITYENGNIIKYSSKGSDGEVYLSIEFIYETVDGEIVDTTSSFNNIYNLDKLIEYLL